MYRHKISKKKFQNLTEAEWGILLGPAQIGHEKISTTVKKSRANQKCQVVCMAVNYLMNL